MYYCYLWIVLRLSKQLREVEEVTQGAEVMVTETEEVMQIFQVCLRAYFFAVSIWLLNYVENACQHMVHQHLKSVSYAIIERQFLFDQFPRTMSLFLETL